MRNARFLFLLVSLMASSAVRAQTVRESIDVRVTNVDFVALDAKGNVVRSLDPATVTVLEDGRPREVTHFAEYKADAAAETAGVRPERTRRIAFFFDDSSLTLPTRRKILDATRQFAKSAAAQGDLIELVTFGRSVNVRQTWTSDLVAIEAALNTIAKDIPSGSMRENERRRLEMQIQSMIRDSEQSQGVIPFGAIFSGAKSYAEQRAAEVDATAGALAAYVRTMDRLDGRKILVLSSESLPTRPGRDIYQWVGMVQSQLASSRSRYASAARNSSDAAEADRHQKAVVLQQVADSANRHGVVLYALNPTIGGEARSGTIERSSPVIVGSDVSAGIGSADGMQLLANSTGGAAYLGMSPMKALEQIGNELRSYYSLAFRSDSSNPARRIELRTSVPGVRLRHSKGLSEIAPNQESQPPIDLADAPPPNTLDIVLQRGDSSRNHGRTTVQLKVLIPADRLKLLPQPSGEMAGSFSIYMQFKDRDGTELSSINKQTHQLRWSTEQAAASKGRRLTVVTDVVINGARDQVTVRVVDDSTQVTGFSTIDLSGAM